MGKPPTASVPFLVVWSGIQGDTRFSKLRVDYEILPGNEGRLT